jgi:hypothetical protein
MCICNVLNGGNKIMSAIGLSNYASKDDGEGALEDGKKIIQRGSIFININNREGMSVELSWSGTEETKSESFIGEEKR